MGKRGQEIPPEHLSLLFLSACLTVKALQHGLVPQAFLVREKGKEALDGRLQFTLRPIPHFSLIPLAELTIGDTPGDLINSLYVGVPTDEVDKQRKDGGMFPH